MSEGAIDQGGNNGGDKRLACGIKWPIGGGNEAFKPSPSSCIDAIAILIIFHLQSHQLLVLDLVALINALFARRTHTKSSLVPRHAPRCRAQNRLATARQNVDVRLKGHAGLANKGV